MDIRDFTFNLLKVYEEMSRTFSAYQESSNLACFSGCGRCCTYPEIESTELEMLPFAWKVLQEGSSDAWLERLEAEASGPCALFVPHGETGFGRCSQYDVRPSICRMFGVAGTLDKTGQTKLSVCKHIKEASPETVLNLEASQTSNPAPIMAHWSSEVSSLHPDFTGKRMPMNQAMLSALRKVAYYAELSSTSEYPSLAHGLPCDPTVV